RAEAQGDGVDQQYAAFGAAGDRRRMESRLQNGRPLGPDGRPLGPMGGAHMAHLHNLNVLPIVVSAVAAWIFGAIYYGVLGPRWMAAQGKTIEQCKAENAGKSTAAKTTPFVLSFIAEIVMAITLSGIIFHVGVYTVRAGVISGAVCWLGFVLTT